MTLSAADGAATSWACMLGDHVSLGLIAALIDHHAQLGTDGAHIWAALLSDPNIGPLLIPARASTSTSELDAIEALLADTQAMPPDEVAAATFGRVLFHFARLAGADDAVLVSKHFATMRGKSGPTTRVSGRLAAAVRTLAPCASLPAEGLPS